ncbi:MAG: U32 family peptidase, partial [Bacteroidetes bacterium]|nr:U32 family peptidase [Bacteroidota bacterium]
MAKKESDKAGVPRIPELLAPAGNYEKLVTAIHYGADSIYLGGKEFGLRAKAGNFSIEAIEKGVSYCHENNKKIYVTVNIFAHNHDLEGVRKYLTALKELKVDGLIVSDPGILSLARVCVPEISLHLSTQA